MRGEKIVLALKFMNHKSHRNRRSKRAFPFMAE
jgi:hypothetical protein